MGEASEGTKKRLLESAKKEFLEKGFMGASLRTIAANAGVTTGAMYRHFKDKDAFFCALVDNAIDETTRAIMTADDITHIKDGNPLSKSHADKENKILSEMLDYIYSDFDAFTLLVEKAAGSTHEKFVEEMSDLYTENCIKTFDWMYRQNISKIRIDSMTVHIIASGIINAFADLISHKIPKEQAVPFINNIRSFFHYGTLCLMGISGSV